ncbi:MAG: hypothetical protein ACRDGG_05930 [Anaerolineae bacterium]
MDDTNDETPEQKLKKLRRTRAQAAVSQLRADAQARGVDEMTMVEIDIEIRSARRSREKPTHKRH